MCVATAIFSGLYRRVVCKPPFRNDFNMTLLFFDRSMRWRLVVDTEVARETADGTQYIPAFLSSVNVELFQRRGRGLGGAG